jgi:hypothetical protein
MKNLLLFFVAMITLTYTSQATARLQVIHNSADLAAASVDVWLDNTLLLDNFAFRTATPFIDAPSGVNFKISIQPSSSTDTVNALFTKTFNLQDGKTYVVIANGIVSGSGYAPATPFDLYAYDMGREAATAGSNTDILVFHGSTDAPVVDVKEVAAGAGTIVDDLAYGTFAGYLELPTADYSLQIRDSHGITTVAQYDAPLATLGLNGAAAVAVASGFLDPGMNSNGPAFGIYVALPSGGDLVALPPVAISTARVQVIHNSADAAASAVDVWLNDIKLIDNFEFRTATPYVDAPAGVPITISIKDASSTDPSNPIASFNYTLTGGMTYQIIANGIVSTSGYNPAPAFNLDVFAGAREKVNTAGNVDVLVYHGSTDAPTVDVVETGVGAGTIVDNLSYSQFAGYLELAPLDYKLEVRDETGTVTVVSYDAPLATLGLENFALTVLASGFLDPSMNSNGPSFGLYAALSVGGPLVALPVATGINDVLSPVSELAVYPNPATDQITVQYALRSASDVKIELKNMIGQTVKTIDAGNKTAGSYSQQIEFKSLNDGIYLLNVKAGKENYATKIVVD